MGYFLGMQLGVDPVGISLFESHSQQVLFNDVVVSSYGYVESLSESISGRFEDVGITFDALEGIGVVVGPGSYTGLRLSVVCAKTLAQVLKKPLFGVTLFEAALMPFSADDGTYMVVMPAVKGMLNVQVWGINGSSFQVLSTVESVDESSFGALLGRMEGVVTVVAVGHVLEGFKASSSDVVVKQSTVSGLDVAQLAVRYFRSGDDGDYTQVTPFYSHAPKLGPGS